MGDHGRCDEADRIIEFQNGSPDIPSELRIDPGFIEGYLAIADGISAPSAISGFGTIYIDSADGDLKVRFGDGTIKTIVTDS